MEGGALALAGLAAFLPGKAVHQQGKAMVGLGKAHVADADDGILRGRGNDVEIFGVERQEFEIGHEGEMSGVEAVGAEMG